MRSTAMRFSVPDSSSERRFERPFPLSLGHFSPLAAAPPSRPRPPPAPPLLPSPLPPTPPPHARGGNREGAPAPAEPRRIAPELPAAPAARAPAQPDEEEEHQQQEHEQRERRELAAVLLVVRHRLALAALHDPLGDR